MNFKQKYWKWLIPVLCIGYCLFEVSGRGDFYIFLSAAGDLDRHGNIFETRYVDGYHYYYSVLFALILKPLVSLPYLWVKFCWILLNALLFFNLLQMLFKSALVNKLSNKQQTLFMVLVFIASMRFFVENIHASQITILILWCCIKGLVLISKDKPFAGAVILALGINIKLLPVVFIPYLIYRGYFKAAVFTVLFYILFMFFPSLIIGHEYNMQLLSAWAKLIDPTNQQHILDVDERSFHGLSTLFSTLMVKDVPDVYALEIPRNIANVSLETLSKIILFVRVTLIGFTLYFLKLNLFARAKNVFSQCLEVSYILLLIPLIFPHQQHYAFLFAMPAFLIILYTCMNQTLLASKKWITTTGLIVIYFTFNLKLILGEFNEYYDHFKIITYGALLLIILLIITANSLKKQNYFSP